MSIYAQITQEYHISAEREKRAQEIVQQRALQFKGLGIDSVDAVVNIHHITAIQRVASGLLDVSCTCPDWRTRGKAQRSPCKHILALAKEIDAHGLLQGVAPVGAPVATTPVQHRRPSPPPPPAMPAPSVPASFAD